LINKTIFIFFALIITKTTRHLTIVTNVIVVTKYTTFNVNSIVVNISCTAAMICLSVSRCQMYTYRMYYNEVHVGFLFLICGIV